MEDGFGDNRTSFAQTGAGAGPTGTASDAILDIREYDVPYYLRVAIDKGRA
jgi:DNA polymerase epsilon subunit 1